MSSLSERLAQAIDAAESNPSKASLAAGLSRNAAKHIISGKVKSPTVETIVAIADAIGADANFIMTGKRALPSGDDDPYPSRVAVVRMLEARPDTPHGTIEALLAERYDGGDPGTDYWLDLAARWEKRIRRFAERAGVDDPRLDERPQV